MDAPLFKVIPLHVIMILEIKLLKDKIILLRTEIITGVREELCMRHVGG